MVEDDYPYGRKGYPFCFHNGPVPREKLEDSGDFKDNEVSFEAGGETVYLYEAPAEDDTGRGHYSIWNHMGGGMYECEYAISGDDGSMYDNYQSDSKD